MAVLSGAASESGRHFSPPLLFGEAVVGNAGDEKYRSWLRRHDDPCERRSGSVGSIGSNVQDGS
jgi:hypothetical protein